jgi:predicted ATP-grasp superfamily ATP-dependent carboligase
MRGQVIAIVDPLSTGATLAAEVFSSGYQVIAVWDKDLPVSYRSNVPKCARGLKYHAQVDEQPSIEETAGAVRAAAGELELIACIVGMESGVVLADALSQELGLRSNGICDGRRDKKIQQELVKNAGLRSVRQAGGKEWTDVEAFVLSEEMPIIVKPTQSAGSDGVKLCHSVEEAKSHFQLLMTSQKKLGGQDAAVLCQEFLKGQEYVVDHVSCNGVHKTVMIWMYDKRRANGAAFVYYGMVPVEADSPEGQLLVPYVRGVLDALGIQHGASHGEVMMTSTGPCLVEMNCRLHGGDGNFMGLARALTGGYSQVDATLTAFVDKEGFEKLPDVPPSPFFAYGQEVMLVSFVEGKVVSTPGYDRIKEMESFVSLEHDFPIGTYVEKSVDLFTSAGSVVFLHQDRDILEQDIEEVRRMEVECRLFELKAAEPQRVLTMSK